MIIAGVGRWGSSDSNDRSVGVGGWGDSPRFSAENDLHHEKHRLCVFSSPHHQLSQFTAMRRGVKQQTRNMNS